MSKAKREAIITDENTGVIILMDTQKRIDEMKIIIGQLDVPRKTKRFELEYVGAAKVALELKGGLTKDIGEIDFDDKENVVTVTDIPSKIEQVERLIKTMDAENRSVVIEAKVYQMNLDDDHKDGIDWEAIVSDYKSVSFPDFVNKTEEGKLSFGTIFR